jgi:hypothetical protein
MMIGLPLVSYIEGVSCREGVFIDCIFGKHHQDNFDKHASWHASTLLQLIHSDLYGVPCSPSFFRCKCFLTFINGFSRCTWFYLLKIKSEVFDSDWIIILFSIYLDPFRVEKWRNQLARPF